ncbi:MAG: N-acetylmuramoyl-L-alanine amidase [Lachnospiraceae bacterium]|nr:N-acetylmuramoyl-L-alanine amidase [Lachnospiraceae bacterium]
MNAYFFKKLKTLTLMCVLFTVALTGCSVKKEEAADPIQEEPASMPVIVMTDEEPEPAVEAEESDPYEESDFAEEETEEIKGYIAIDAGHQKKGNSGKEPLGPGSNEMKAKVSGGTTGVATGIPEYELNLQVALKLRDELEERGYRVLMIRETNDVDISNSERAQMANDAGVDALIRIHANGSEDPSVNGAMTICQTPKNPYNADLYEESRALSEKVLDAFAATTGARKEKIWETDSMTGINWCRTPVTIIEMGYMSNPDEDRRMSSEDYQVKMVQGMADGIDAYIEGR